MNPFSILSMNWFEIILFVVFAILLIAFLKEFKLTSTRSWVMLLGFTALGGLFVFQRWRRKKLLEQFREREKELEKIEERYNELRKNGEITEEAYNDAKKQLEKAKVEEGLAIMRADELLTEQLEKIEKEYSDLTIEESIAKIKDALK